MITKKMLSFVVVLIIAVSLTACQENIKKRDFNASMKQGENYYAEGDFEKAIEEFKKAAEIMPESADAYQNIAVCYSNLFLTYKSPTEHEACVGVAENAVKYYRKTLELDPARAESQFNMSNEYAKLASMFMDDGDLPNARVYLKKKIEIDPAAADAYYTMGVIDWGLCYAQQKPEGLFGVDEYIDKIASDDSALSAISRAARISKEKAAEMLNIIKTPEADVVKGVDTEILAKQIKTIKEIKPEQIDKIIECVGTPAINVLKCISRNVPDLSIAKAKQARGFLTKNIKNMSEYTASKIGISKEQAERGIEETLTHLKFTAIDNGISYINKSLEINPEAPDSYQYLTMLYIEKIKIEDSSSAIKDYAQKAEDNFRKASRLRDKDKSDADVDKEVKTFREQLNKQLLSRKR